MKIVAIVLTFNEALHLPRCLASLQGVVDAVLVVDSGSTDATVTLAQALGARVVHHPWVNYAAQFNWALTQLGGDTDWVLRIDADEYLKPELAAEIRNRLPTINASVDGIFLNRHMTFQRRIIRYGGIFPVRVLRLFRFGRGQCENRWMDEHIKISGQAAQFSGDLIDDSLQSLSWWTDKHNHYASREAVDLLNLEYGFMPKDSIASFRNGSQAGLKRWLKEEVYARMPGGVRAFLYYFYRYVLRLGFLDGTAGASFHFLQGFWYRFLVDAKIHEVKRCMQEHDLPVTTAIERVLGIRVTESA